MQWIREISEYSISFIRGNIELSLLSVIYIILIILYFSAKSKINYLNYELHKRNLEHRDEVMALQRRLDKSIEAEKVLERVDSYQALVSRLELEAKEIRYEIGQSLGCHSPTTHAAAKEILIDLKALGTSANAFMDGLSANFDETIERHSKGVIPTLGALILSFSEVQKQLIFETELRQKYEIFLQQVYKNAELDSNIAVMSLNHDFKILNIQNKPFYMK